MNFNNLKVFVDLAETLSFSKSAQNLKIAQPAVSRSIKNLEAELGMQLFIRNNRHVYLTSQGEGLKRSLVPLIQQINESIHTLQENETEMKGTLRIGSLVEFAEFKLLPIINEIKSYYPNLEIKLDMAGERELRNRFFEGKLDLILGIKPMTAENVKSFRYLDQKSLLFTNFKSKKTKKKIEEMNFIAYRDNDPLIQSYLKKYHPHKSYQGINIVFTANSHKAMVDYLCHQPDCYAILPELSSSVADALASKKLYGNTREFLDTPIYLSYWDYEFVSPSLNLLIDLLRKKSSQ